jgi:phosphopantothenoylcysteine decarboxylase/phosphopantothenate--cysteine ligase
MAHRRSDIIGIEGDELRDRRILLAVTGSASAYRAPDIARLLMRHGADVFPIMSDMAEQIIHPNLLEWATGNRTITKLTGRSEHIEYTIEESKGDILLIAPCTANTISKIANGVADTPITSCALSALGAELPIVIAPAMHANMYQQPIVQENVRKLTELGVVFVGPVFEEGKAKLASPDGIYQAVLEAIPRRDYAGRKLLITAGPTVEHIDPVRIITNPSSGKMGSALAFEAIRRGASVTIVHGPITVPLPTQARKIPVQSTIQMYNETLRELRSSQYDVAIATAAPADYAPTPSEKKIETDKHGKLVLELAATPKIVDEIKKASPNTFLVAYRAQTGMTQDLLINDGYERLKTASANLIAVNDIGRSDIGFGSDYNEVILIDHKRQSKVLRRDTKRAIAKQLLNEISQQLAK